MQVLETKGDQDSDFTSFLPVASRLFSSAWIWIFLFLVDVDEQNNDQECRSSAGSLLQDR